MCPASPDPINAAAHAAGGAQETPRARFQRIHNSTRTSRLSLCTLILFPLPLTCAALRPPSASSPRQRALCVFSFDTPPTPFPFPFYRSLSLIYSCFPAPPTPPHSALIIFLPQARDGISSRCASAPTRNMLAHDKIAPPPCSPRTALHQRRSAAKRDVQASTT